MLYSLGAVWCGLFHKIVLLSLESFRRGQKKALSAFAKMLTPSGFNCTEPNGNCACHSATLPSTGILERFVRAGKYQSALSDKDVNWPYAHSPDVDKLHPSHLATFFHKSPIMLVSSILFVFLSMRADRRNERGKRFCQDVDTFSIQSHLAKCGGQLRLPLCDTAKYCNSRKGLSTQASINRRLVTKMWIGMNWPYAHSPDVDKFHPSNWATFFHKSPVILLSLIICGIFSFSIQLHWAKCGGNCACYSATLPSTGILERFVRAGKYQLALRDKDVNWPYVHSPDVDKFHSSNFMLLSFILFVFFSIRTDRNKAWYLCQDVDTFSI